MDAAPHFTDGKTLGEFRAVSVLGQGGSGIVYDAVWGPRRVALKVLHPALVDGERVRAQFFAEAARLQAISHPSVVKVLAVGQLPDGRPYLAMERLDGETLASVLARGPLLQGPALALFEELCGAVGALHAQGLVHRDLKPENVFVVRGEAGTQHAVLLDFGIAKELVAPASTTTVDGGVRGTPAYMAPERFFGQPAGVATDIYELAVTLYAMLAGRLPWDDFGDPEARLSPRPLVEWAQVSPELDIEIRRAMSTRAQNRPASAAAMLEAVRVAAGSEATQPSETARMFSGQHVVPPPPQPTKAWFAERQATTDRGKTPLAWAPTQAATPAQPPPKKRRWPLVVAGVAVAGAAAGTFALVRRGGSDAAPADAAVAENKLVDDDVVAEEKPKPKPARSEVDEDAAKPAPDPNDPWATAQRGDNAPKKALKSFVPSEIPVGSGPELAPEVARKELDAALVHVPADTQVVMTAVIGDMRHHEQFKAVLDKLAKSSRIKEIIDGVPCVRKTLAGAEWAMFAAKSLKEAEHGTLMVRGRWKRADIERCFVPESDALTMPDGAKMLQMKTIGWVDFVDEHTLYLSVREDLAAAQVHDLVKHGHGPRAHVRELFARLPVERTFTAVIDGGNGLVWPEKRIPEGSDATAWFHLEEEPAFDVAVDTHDTAGADKLVGIVKPQFDEVFKDAPRGLVGDIQILREKTTFHIRGTVTPLVMGLLASAVP